MASFRDPPGGLGPTCAGRIRGPAQHQCAILNRHFHSRRCVQTQLREYRFGDDDSLGVPDPSNADVRRVLSVARPERIILFGSAATGQMTKDSDIDLLVVEPALANTHERQVEIRDAVGDVGYPVDVIVTRAERFEETKRWVGGIAYPANKYGRVIYEAA
ncbi:MAG: nucleotidyltransferase domain-containing protein [Bryobacteraceae bacterium]